MIPNTTPPQLDKAVKQFDILERNAPRWKAWEEQPGHEFVIFREKENRIYPVKHIIAVAIGLDEAKIDDLEVLNYAPGQGIKVVSAAKYLKQQAQLDPELRVSPKGKAFLAALLPVADSQLFNPLLLQGRLNRFKESPDQSFTSPFYLEEERNYKVAASELLHQSFGEKGEKLKALIDESRFKQAATIVGEMYQKDNLLYKPWEVMPFIKADDKALVTLLYELLYGEETFTIRFQNWVQLLSQYNPLCWPAATYHLMLLAPQEHIFVKPGTIGNFLKAVGSGITWQPRTNAGFYLELQRFAKAILPELQTLGARDMIDVQSFTWVLRDLS